MINKVILIGRAGKDPELYITKSDKKVVKFSLATWENYRDEKEESGWRQETEWSNIVVWGDSAESLAKYVKKGNLVYVEGKIKTRSYEDKQGVTKYITEIIGWAKSLEKRETSGTSSASTGKAAGNTATKEEAPPEESSEERAQRMMDKSDLPF